MLGKMTDNHLMKYNILNEDFFDDEELNNDIQNELSSDKEEDDDVLLSLEDLYNIYDEQMTFQFEYKFNRDEDVSKFSNSIYLQNILKQFITYVNSLSFIKEEYMLFSVYSVPLLMSCGNDIDKIKKYSGGFSSEQFLNNPRIINDRINNVIEETLNLNIEIKELGVYISCSIYFNAMKIAPKRYDRLVNEFMGLCNIWNRLPDLAWVISEQSKARFLYKHNTKEKDFNFICNQSIKDKIPQYIVQKFLCNLFRWDLNDIKTGVCYNCPTGIKKVINSLCIDKSVYDMSLMGYYQDDNDRGVSIMIVFKYNGFKDEKDNTTKAISKYITNILNNLNEYQMGSIIRLTVNVEFYFICDKQTLPVSEHKFDYENYKQSSKYFVKLRTNKQEYNNNIHFSVFFLDEYYRLFPDSYCKDRYAKYDDIIRMTKNNIWKENADAWMKLTKGNCII